jgi:hypothetical protein
MSRSSAAHAGLALLAAALAANGADARGLQQTAKELCEENFLAQEFQTRQQREGACGYSDAAKVTANDDGSLPAGQIEGYGTCAWLSCDLDGGGIYTQKTFPQCVNRQLTTKDAKNRITVKYKFDVVADGVSTTLLDEQIASTARTSLLGLSDALRLPPCEGICTATLEPELNRRRALAAGDGRRSAQAGQQVADARVFNLDCLWEIYDEIDDDVELGLAGSKEVIADLDFAVAVETSAVETTLFRYLKDEKLMKPEVLDPYPLIGIEDTLFPTQPLRRECSVCGAEDSALQCNSLSLDILPDATKDWNACMAKVTAAGAAADALASAEATAGQTGQGPVDAARTALDDATAAVRECLDSLKNKYGGEELVEGGVRCNYELDDPALNPNLRDANGTTISSIPRTHPNVCRSGTLTDTSRKAPAGDRREFVTFTLPFGCASYAQSLTGGQTQSRVDQCISSNDAAGAVGIDQTPVVTAESPQLVFPWAGVEAGTPFTVDSYCAGPSLKNPTDAAPAARAAFAALLAGVVALTLAL